MSHFESIIWVWAACVLLLTSTVTLAVSAWLLLRTRNRS